MYHLAISYGTVEVMVNNQLVSKNGFTLIEILVSILIISLIGIVFFPNLRKFNTNQQFQNESLNIKNQIESAQNMYTTGIRCSASKAASGWSFILSNTTPLSTNLRGYCVNTSLVSSTENIAGTTAANTILFSSNCGTGTTSIELKFDKNGFSYSCNGGSFTSGLFNLQLQNKNDSSQKTVITINTLGTVSQN